MEARRLKIRVFTGKADEWSAWRAKFEALMDEQDLLDSLESGAPSTSEGGGSSALRDFTADTDEAAEEWKKNNRKIFFQLVLHTEGSAAGLVSRYRSTKDGYKAWKGLIVSYEHQGTGGLVTLTMEINACCMEDSEVPDDFLSAMSI